MKNQQKKYRLRLRKYSAATSAIAITASCLISLLISVFVIHMFYQAMYTAHVGIVMSVFTCLLTMATGIYVTNQVAGHFVGLVETANDAVVRITEGQFDTRIPEIQTDRKGAQYLHELDELQRNVNRLAVELSGMDHMRRDFVSNVSHEMKTPLAAIMGISEMLQEKGLSEEERNEYLRLLYDEARRISRLSENMLRISRLDNQGTVAKKRRVRVDEQIRRAVILLAENQPGRRFDLALPAITAMTDADLLQEVWINLIENAMKYSEPDTTIHIRGTAGPDGFAVSIQDEGIGIPEEKREHIFEMFYQCEESHKKSGNGLGLSIVRKILDLLGGRIECLSEEGKGTEMIVRF